VLQSWPEVLTPSTILTVMLLTATVNARFFLMSAGLRPWLGTLPPWQVYPALPLNTDSGWLLSLRYRAQGGADASFWLGGGILTFFFWTFSAVPGYLLAERIADPRTYGVDLLVPAFFAALLVPCDLRCRRRRGRLAHARLLVHDRGRGCGLRQCRPHRQQRWHRWALN
jgi:predicted branched-subunit amino acid permease